MNKLHLIINVVCCILIIGNGLFFDLKMLIFVKNRNQVSPIQLVPWKSTSPQEQAADDSTVPLQASCVSTASLICFGIIAPVYVALVNQMGEL